MTQPAAILRTGAVTSVALNAPSTFAALHARLNNFGETSFLDGKGEPVPAGRVELPWRDEKSPSAPWGPSPYTFMPSGYAPETHPVHRQVELLSLALMDCARGLRGFQPSRVPLLLCVSELTRPGRPANLDHQLVQGLSQRLRCSFARESAVFAYGQASIGMAMHQSFELLQEHPLVLIAGVDSLVDFQSLDSLHARGRLFASDNPDGYIAGEGACALLLGRPAQVEALRPLYSNVPEAVAASSLPPAGSARVSPALYCMGYSVTREMALRGSSAPQPNAAKGLTEAIAGALLPIGSDASQVGLRICSQITTHYSAKEMAIGSARAEVSAAPLWCLADSLGETGAAAGPLTLAWAYAASHKGHAPSNVSLSLTASEEGERSALLLGFGPYRL